MTHTKSDTWEEFKTETGLIGAALVKDGVAVQVKLKSKMPRRFYYSALNEVGLKAEELWPKKGETHE